MNTWKLRLSMAGTLALIIALSSLFFTVILTLVGVEFNLLTMGLLIVTLTFSQWLLSPYLIGAIYKTKQISQADNPQLYQTVSDLSKKSGIPMPKLMLAQIPMPNAFAYGSPIAGNHVAVTDGLLKELDAGEVEAVLAHELGHLKHKDVQIMMTVSFLPSLFYFIGYSFMFTGSSKRNSSGGDSTIISIALIAFSFVLSFFTLYLSRLREYYADKHSVSVVENGKEKLSTGLARIVNSQTVKHQKKDETVNSSFKALFIADTKQNAQSDFKFSGKTDMVNSLLSKEVTFADKLIEALSTHPNITKRLRAIQAS